MCIESWFESLTWRLVLVLLLVCAAADRSFKCEDDDSCQKSCQGATDDVSCPTICDERFPRCVCSDGAALQMDGTCMDILNLQHESPCMVPTHAALFNAALWGSPELLPKDLKSGSPSPAFASIIKRSMASALSQNVQDIAVTATEIRLPRSAQNFNFSYVGIRQFDLALDFCAPGIRLPISKRDFERGFIREASNYAAFYIGTIRLLSLDPLVGPSSQDVTPTNTNTPVVRQEPPPVVIRLRGASADRKENEALANAEAAKGGLLLLQVLGIVGLLVLVVALWLLYRVKSSRRNKSFVFRVNSDMGYGQHTNVHENIAEAAMPAPMASSMSDTYVCVVQAVSLKEIQEWSANFRSDNDCKGFLALEEDDVVKVLAVRSCWYYGHVVGATEECAGYFPENRAKAWLTEPLAIRWQSASEPHAASNPLAALADASVKCPAEGQQGTECSSPHPHLPATPLATPPPSPGRQHEGSRPCPSPSPLLPAMPATPPSTPPPTPGRQELRASVDVASMLPRCAAGEIRPPDVHQAVPAPPEFSPWSEPDPPSESPPCLQSSSKSVCEAHAFSPEEVEDEHFRSNLLTLAEGDVVEVMAGGSGWLYGQILGTTGRQGYFPEDRAASWLSRPTSDASPDG